MIAREVVAVQALPHADVEEEEVVVDEEEDEGPAFEEAIEMSRRDQSQPSEGGSDDGELLEQGGFSLKVPGEAVDAVGGDGDRRHPWPEQPRPAEVHPEERAEEEIRRPFCGGDRDGQSQTPLEDVDGCQLEEG